MLDAASTKTADADGIQKQPAISLSLQTPSSIYRRFGKRTLDILIVILTYPLISPIILLCMLAVMTDGASPFFGHKRIGRNGKTFQCWKLRTMVPDAEAHLEKLLANDIAARHEWQTTFKLKNDPRITRVGNFLRKTSLDELPQIWNVALGDMSIVGPRPVTECELQMYCPNRDVYLAMRPGLTGAWQISGRNNVSYEERVRLDVGYFNEICLRRDLQIIFKTFKVLVSRTGL